MSNFWQVCCSVLSKVLLIKLNNQLIKRLFMEPHIQHNYNDPDRRLSYIKILFFCYVFRFSRDKATDSKVVTSCSWIDNGQLLQYTCPEKAACTRDTSSQQAPQQPIDRPCEMPSKMFKSSKIIILIFPTRVLSGCALFRVSTWPKERNFKRLVFLYQIIPWDFLSCNFHDFKHKINGLL